MSALGEGIGSHRSGASSLLLDALGRSTTSRASWLAEVGAADARLAAGVAELLRALEEGPPRDGSDALTFDELLP